MGAVPTVPMAIPAVPVIVPGFAIIVAVAAAVGIEGRAAPIVGPAPVIRSAPAPGAAAPVTAMPVAMDLNESPGLLGRGLISSPGDGARSGAGIG